MADRGTTAPRPPTAGAAGDDELLRRLQISEPAEVPAWVHRMHADGLSATEASLRAPLVTGSQRYIERWSRVSGGY